MQSKKLGKMKMPEKGRKEEDMSELDMPEAEAMEGEEMAMEESDMGEEMPSGSDLSSLSDDELMAEIKKRGLMKDLGSEMPAEEEDQDQEQYS